MTGYFKGVTLKGDYNGVECLGGILQYAAM